MTEPVEANARRRAASGAGSVRLRGKTWTAYWFVTDPATGKRQQRSKGGFRIQREAQAHLNSQQTKAAEGPYQAKADLKLTVAQLIDAWLVNRKLKGLKPATLAGYRNTADSWIVNKIGGLKAEELSTEIVEEWMARLLASGGKRGGPLSARSVQYAGTVLRMACKWGVKTKRLRFDPTAVVTLPSAAGTKMLVWGREDATSFAAHIGTDRLGVLYLIGLTRGMRRGELCGLRWANVDLVAGHLNVVETRIIVGGTDVQTSTPKTEAGKRRVPLDAGLVAALTAHRLRQKEERMAFGAGWTDTGYVFTMEDGTPVKPDYVSDKFTRLCKAADVPVIRLHDLRHGVVSHLLEAGYSPGVVADLVGHADASVTLRVYGHSMPGATDVAGEALSRSLGIVVDKLLTKGV